MWLVYVTSFSINLQRERESVRKRLFKWEGLEIRIASEWPVLLVGGGQSVHGSMRSPPPLPRLMRKRAAAVGSTWRQTWTSRSATMAQQRKSNGVGYSDELRRAVTFDSGFWGRKKETQAIIHGLKCFIFTSAQLLFIFISWPMHMI